MAKIYEVTTAQRAANRLFGVLVRQGVGADYRYLLTVRGRTTGKLHSTPVDVMQDGDQRWLVAPYGTVNWVRKLRAAGGQLTLRRGRHVEHLAAQELEAEDAVPVIRRYIRSVRSPESIGTSRPIPPTARSNRTAFTTPSSGSSQRAADPPLARW